MREEEGEGDGGEGVGEEDGDNVDDEILGARQRRLEREPEPDIFDR